MTKGVPMNSSTPAAIPGGLLSATVAALLALGTGGCGAGAQDDGLGGAGGQDGSNEISDRDGDGYTVEDGDCDDRNNRIFPGAEERSDDGIDSNCDDEELPIAELVWSAGAPDNQVDALRLLDTDDDGNVTLAEFAAQCEKSAQLVGESRPGLVQVHASCAGNNSCKGMVYQSWNEIYEHSCRGVNGCAGWSCVELAEDKQRNGVQAFEDAHCGYCHSPTDGGKGLFQVPVRPGNDVESYLAEFWSSRSAAHVRSVVAFGVTGITESGVAFANMPGAYRILSLAETDALIAHVQTLGLVAHEIDPLVAPDPIE
jgi:hypothetical protein